MTNDSEAVYRGVKRSLQRIDLSETVVDISAVALIPRQIAEKYGMLAVREEDNVLLLAVTEPLNYYGIEDIRQVTGKQIALRLCEAEPLEKALRYYYSEISAKTAARQANGSSPAESAEPWPEEPDQESTPVMRLLHTLLERAAVTNASDIHIEPFEKKTRVRMRIDGTIVEYVTLQKSLHASLIARIKILSDMDTAERRLPQDGHFRISVKGETVNLRVSVIPTVFGEKAVLRLLAGRAAIERSDTFGMKEEAYRKFCGLLQSPHGIIYLTGPTGSGKSTTLYMILEKLSKERYVNISTIEEPVEKNVPGINQMQVNHPAGLTFESGLRAILRQDPDIIMVGETRDPETAVISARAAITGHLVFSTLHTNDAVSSIVRLADMGLEPYIIAGSLAGVAAQRLMRKVCPACAVSGEPTEEESIFMGRAVKKVMRPRGCRLCNNTGYHGRIAVHEILTVDSRLRDMISRRASVEEMKAYALREQGMKPLKECAIEIVEEGLSTIEELRKAAYYVN